MHGTACASTIEPSHSAREFPVESAACMEHDRCVVTATGAAVFGAPDLRLPSGAGAISHERPRLAAGHPCPAPGASRVPGFTQCGGACCCRVRHPCILPRQCRRPGHAHLHTCPGGRCRPRYAACPISAASYGLRLSGRKSCMCMPSLHSFVQSLDQQHAHLSCAAMQNSTHAGKLLAV